MLCAALCQGSIENIHSVSWHSPLPIKIFFQNLLFVSVCVCVCACAKNQPIAHPRSALKTYFTNSPNKLPQNTGAFFFFLHKQVNHGSSLSLHSFSGLHMQLQKSEGEKKVDPSEEGHVPLEHSNWTAAKGEKSL